MNNPYQFIDENLKTGSKNNLESHNINHAKSIRSIISIYSDFGIETRYMNKIPKNGVFYARIMKQYIFEYPIIFSASFYKTNKEYQRSDEIDFFITSNIDHELTESDIIHIHGKSHLGHPIQIQETEENGWIFDKVNSMKIRFYRTGGLNCSSYVKNPLRSNTILNIESFQNYFFLWSVLATLHPCKNDHPNRV